MTRHQPRAADLLDVADDLVILRTGGCNEHRGHTVGNQGDGSVLHLRRREAFRVDVADFFELQGPFKGHRVVESPAQKTASSPSRYWPPRSRGCGRIVAGSHRFSRGSGPARRCNGPASSLLR